MKLIWAAVYAERLSRGFVNVPTNVVLDKKRWEEHEANIILRAVEVATGAIHRIRGALPIITEKYGLDSDEVRAVRDMIGK